MNWDIRIIIAVAAIPPLLFLADRYLFSWVGLILSRIPSSENSLCDHKSVWVPSNNAEPKALSFVIKWQSFSEAMRLSSSYHILDHGHIITLYRKFGKVWYRISIHHYSIPKSVTKMTVGTGTPLDLFRHGEPSVTGENCIIPSAWLKHRVFRMIDDLPLSKREKAEMKRNIRAGCVGNLRWFF